MESARLYLNNWLSAVLNDEGILRTQAMYQFLCAEANLVPPRVTLVWNAKQTFAEDGDMGMDEMYHDQNDDYEDRMDEDSDNGNRDGDDEADETKGHDIQRSTQKRSASASEYGTSYNRRPYDGMDDEDEGDLDVQSISCTEADFMFDKNTPLPASSAAPVAVQRKIKLESFDIIKVIGKGSFGKVFLVRDKMEGTLHAMKVLRKDYIKKKNQVDVGIA